MKLAQQTWSRRRFLCQSAMATGGITVLGAAAPPEPIIDTHIHLYDPTRPGGVRWPAPGDGILYAPHLPAQFRQATKGFAVTGAIVIEANAWPEDNRWVLEQAKKDPLIVGYIGRLSPGQPDFAAHFDEYLTDPIFRGLRLRDDMLAQGLGQAAFEHDVQRLGEHGLTADIVGSASVLAAIPRLAKIAPNLRMVIDHLPFPDWDQNPTAMREALREVAALPNVFAKVSYVLRRKDGKLLTSANHYKPGLDALWDLFGEDRVVYGSNWPVSDLMAPYASVLQVVTDYVTARGEAASRKFFWKNSIAAYQWKQR